VEVTVDYQKSKPCLTPTDVTTHKEETMVRKQTNTIGIKTKASLTMSLREKCIALISVASLVFGFDGGMAPPTA
jgi:hypothetical protein